MTWRSSSIPISPNKCHGTRACARSHWTRQLCIAGAAAGLCSPHQAGSATPGQGRDRPAFHLCGRRYPLAEHTSGAIRSIGTGNSGQRDNRPKFYMHLCEGEINVDFFSAYFDLLRTSPHRLKKHSLEGAPSWQMWNAGVIGVPKQEDRFFSQTLYLNDELLPLVRFRNCIEQLALSLIAQRDYQIRPFENWLHHYWPVNNEAAILLRSMFERIPADAPVAEQLRHYKEFKWDESAMHDIQNSPAQRRANWRAKVRNSFYKRKIDLKAFLLRRSLRNDETDREL